MGPESLAGDHRDFAAEIWIAYQEEEQLLAQTSLVVELSRYERKFRVRLKANTHSRRSSHSQRAILAWEASE